MYYKHQTNSPLVAVEMSKIVNLTFQQTVKKAVPFYVKGTAYIDNLCNTIRFGLAGTDDGKLY